LQTARAHAQSLLEFMVALGLYRAVLIGHSLGGAVALHFALEFPQHVVGLGLISASARFQVPEAPCVALDNLTLRHEALRNLEAWALPLWLPLPVRQQMGRAFERLRPQVLAADWKAVAEFDVRDRLSELRVPTWILHGAKDPLVSRSDVEGFARAAGVDVEVEGLEQSGHWLMVEQPRAVAAWLHRFLATINALAPRSPAALRESRALLQPQHWETDKPKD